MNFRLCLCLLLAVAGGPLSAVAAPASVEEAVAALPPIDLTLDQAERLGAANHPRVAAAQARARAARQQVREARSDFFPQVTGDALAVEAEHSPAQLGAVGSLAPSTAASRQSDGVNATQLITDFGRTASLTAEARHTARSEAADAAATRAQILLGVDQAYFEVLKAKEILRVAEETVAARRLLLDRVTALMQAHLKSELDVSFVQVDFGRARLLKIESESRLNEAFAQFSNALGYGEPRAFRLAKAEPYGAPAAELPPLLDHAFGRRPEIVALSQQAAAANSFVAAQRAAQYPKITAIGSAGVNPVRDPADLGGDYAAAGIDLSLPLLNGGRLSAQVSEARYRSVDVQRRLDALRNDVARDVRTVWLRAGTAYRQIGVSEELLASAAQSFDLAQARYTSGLSSIVELSQAQLNKTQAEIDLATARYAYQTLAADLKYQIGDFR